MRRTYTLAIILATFTSVCRAHDGVCTLIPRGNGRDDSEQLHVAIASPRCREILLPQPYTYTIQRRLLTDLTDKVLNVHGTLSFSDDLAYWIDNGWPVDFQDHQTAWIATGSNWVMSGGGWNRGGIDGNGQAWYLRAQGVSNQNGRPISLQISNASDALVKDFAIVQPQFWAVSVDRSKNITLDGLYVNATNMYPPEPSQDGINWVTNTDGIDTYRSDHIVIKNWVVQNGDDCVSFKGNSTNIFVSNVTCYATGSPGIAVGSLGQYPDRVDYVENVTVRDLRVVPAAGVVKNPAGAAYFKAWIGVPIGSPPNGGGGGTGLVSNITLEDIRFENASLPLYVLSCLTYTGLNVSQYCNTSTLEFRNVLIKDFKGTSSGSTAVSLACSSAAPCSDWEFEDFKVAVPAQYTAEYVCQNTVNITGIQCT